MYRALKLWLNRCFYDEEAAILAWLLLLGSLIVIVLGHILAPLLASVVFAFLLDWMSQGLERQGLKRKYALTVVYVGFLATIILSCFGLVPILLQQTQNFFHDLPNLASRGQDELTVFLQRFPDLFSQAQLDEISSGIATGLKDSAKYLLSASVSWLPGVVTGILYLILIPIMVLLLLKDKKELLDWFVGYLPKTRPLMNRVSNEVNAQLGNYIRGKFVEFVVVTLFTYLGFIVFNLNYAALLALGVGLSVWVPFIGGLASTIPVVLVAYLQFGLGATFGWSMLVFAVIQMLDGNLLAPLLFGEAVKIHPVAILIAVILFGGLLGFWGMFFAIPLAALVKAVLLSWPMHPTGKR